MKDKYRRRMLKPAGPPANASAASRTTGSAPPPGRGKSMAAMIAMSSGVGMGRSVRTSKPHGSGGQGIGSTAPPSMQGAQYSSVIAGNHNRMTHGTLARPYNWLYNGTPALCRKCGIVFVRGCSCRRDAGHVCELESVASAEERRLLEVNRMLKDTFDGPRPAQSLQDYWKELVGLQARVSALEDRN